MTDYRQFTENTNLERDSITPRSSTQMPNVNPSSEFSSTARNTAAATSPTQPLRPRMTIPIPSISSIPPFPGSSPGMNMNSFSLVSPLGRSNSYQLSPGFLRSPHEEKKQGRKSRRKRTTPAQLAELLKVFETNDNPSHDVREMLSKRVNMTNREVQVWFQNRRAKEAHTDKKQEQSDQKAGQFSDSPPTDMHDQSMEGPTRKKIQPIQAAPYPPRSRSYSYASTNLNQFSPFRRMSLSTSPDGRTVFFPQPGFTVPIASSANAQEQFIQQQQPMQFMPQSAASFLPTAGNPMQAYPGVPQMMLVPVFASPQGFVPASGSGYAYAPPPMYSGSARVASNEVTGGSRRGSLMYWPEPARDVPAPESRIAVKVEPESPKVGAEALNALASAASEQSLADSDSS